MVPFHNQIKTMPNLSIKNVPERVVEKLRKRAAANHRSMQGELMALVCQASENSILEPGPLGMEQAAGGWKSVEQILTEHRATRPQATASGPRAVDIIRQERDAR